MSPVKWLSSKASPPPLLISGLAWYHINWKHMKCIFLLMHMSFFWVRVFPVWMFEKPIVDPNIWMMKQSVGYNTKTIQAKGKGSLLEFPSCCTVQFYLSVGLILYLNWVEHHNQNCASFCILICSPRILLYFQWSKVGYGARGYSFSVHPFFLRLIRIWNPPSHLIVIKGKLCMSSMFLHCLNYIIRRSGQCMAQCS